MLVKAGELMKVCVIGTRGFPYIEGGVEKHCESLYPLFGDDVQIVVYRRKPYVKGKKYYKNISFIDLPSTKIKGIETVIHSLLATIYTMYLKPDIVHYHNIGPALFSPLLKLQRIPIVVTYHSPNYEHKKWGIFAKRLLLFSEKITIKYSDILIFVNRYQMDKYPDKIKKKAFYIPNGITKPCKSINQNYLEEIGVKPGKYILSVGRITQEKGFDTLIKAYRLSKCKNYKLVIAGGVEFENKYMQELKELSQELDVIFTGYIYGDNLAQVYGNAALYVLASYNEGFPLVLLEAMSYELDVLVSDIPATHLVELQCDDYFAKGDYGDLSEKICRKLASPHKRKYNLKEYDWNHTAKQTLTIFKKLERKKSKN